MKNSELSKDMQASSFKSPENIPDLVKTFSALLIKLKYEK